MATRLLRRGQAGHWSFLFSQIAAYSFAVAVVTGVFLAVFFQPSTARSWAAFAAL